MEHRSCQRYWCCCWTDVTSRVVELSPDVVHVSRAADPCCCGEHSFSSAHVTKRSIVGVSTNAEGLGCIEFYCCADLQAVELMTTGGKTGVVFHLPAAKYARLAAWLNMSVAPHANTFATVTVVTGGYGRLAPPPPTEPPPPSSSTSTRAIQPPTQPPLAPSPQPESITRGDAMSGSMRPVVAVAVEVPINEPDQTTESIKRAPAPQAADGPVF